MAKHHTLPKLYQRMAELTQPKCATECRVKQSCCSDEYCDMAIEWAKDKYGTVLPTTDHPTLPLMGPNGCTAAPHFRPLCTLHLCSIQSLGFDPDPVFNRLYFNLRNRISKLEARDNG